MKGLQRAICCYSTLLSISIFFFHSFLSVCIAGLVSFTLGSALLYSGLGPTCSRALMLSKDIISFTSGHFPDILCFSDNMSLPPQYQESKFETNELSTICLQCNFHFLRISYPLKKRCKNRT